MQSGTVKWFNDPKGFGFISTGEKDVFVHYSQVERNEEGYRTLAEGDAVSFIMAEGPKGFYAVNVQKVQP